MAVSKLIAVGNQKGGIGATLDYVSNPAKTENGGYVFGFNCTPETAACEFEITKINADKIGGRQGYHLIQSFAPGDNLTAEKAHEIGKELAEKLLGGKYEFLVATHTNCAHLHNHIVFNSVSFKDKKKFHGGANIFHKIAHLNDMICHKHGLSIIENPKEKGKSYAEYNAERQGKSWKGKLRETINRCIEKACDWEEFLTLMQAENYEIKHGKHISFRANEQERFTRAKTLGENYSEDKIKFRIIGEEITTPVLKRETKETIPLIIDIDNTLKIKQSAGYTHWAEMRNLKIAAATINYLSDNRLLAYSDLSAKHDELKSKRDSSLARIKEVESRIKILKVQIEDLETYRKNKSVVEKLDSVVFKEKYKREHESEFILFNAAKKSCKAHFPSGKYPLIKTLRAELNELYSEKEKLYPEYYSAKDEFKNISTMKQNVDLILREESEPLTARVKNKNRNEPEL